MHESAHWKRPESQLLRNYADRLARAFRRRRPRISCAVFGRLPQFDDGWELLQSTSMKTQFSWRTCIILAGKTAKAQLCIATESAAAMHSRAEALGARRGVAVSQMGDLPATLYSGEIFDDNVACVDSARRKQSCLRFGRFARRQNLQTQFAKIDQEARALPMRHLSKSPSTWRTGRRWRRRNIRTDCRSRFPATRRNGCSTATPPVQTSRCTWPWRGCSATSGRARPVPVFPIARRSARMVWKRWRMTTASSASPPAKGEAPAAERLRDLLAARLRQGLERRPAATSCSAPGGSRRRIAGRLAAQRLLRAALRALPPAPLHLAHLGRPQERLQRPGELPPAHPRQPGKAHLHLPRRLDPPPASRRGGRRGRQRRPPAGRQAAADPRSSSSSKASRPTTSSSAGSRSPSKPSAGTPTSTTACA